MSDVSLGEPYRSSRTTPGTRGNTIISSLFNDLASSSFRLGVAQRCTILREETGVAARKFHSIINRAREMADKEGVKLHTHVLAGHPVRDIVDLARDLKADLLGGGSGHTALYERLIGS